MQRSSGIVCAIVVVLVAGLQTRAAVIDDFETGSFDWALDSGNYQTNLQGGVLGSGTPLDAAHVMGGFRAELVEAFPSFQGSLGVAAAASDGHLHFEGNWDETDSPAPPVTYLDYGFQEVVSLNADLTADGATQFVVRASAPSGSYLIMRIRVITHDLTTQQTVGELDESPTSYGDPGTYIFPFADFFLLNPDSPALDFTDVDAIELSFAGPLFPLPDENPTFTSWDLYDFSTSVPEPSGFAVVGIGAISLTRMRARRRRAGGRG